MTFKIYCGDCKQFMDLRRITRHNDEEIEIHKCLSCGDKAVVGNCPKRQ